MPELKHSQVELIRDKIKNQSLKSLVFVNELLDHVCCRIEDLMLDGLRFEEALEQTEHLYSSRAMKKIDRNYSLIFNFGEFINAFIIYASLLFYLGSWIFHWGQSDWIGLTAFLLIGVLHLRYSLLFIKDRNYRHKVLLRLFSVLGFILLFIGSIYRFLWLNFGANGQHVMPALLFAWLFISLTGIIYLRALFPKKINLVLQLIAFMQLVLSLVSLSTFIFPGAFYYIPVFASVIIVVNCISFLILFAIKGRGKTYLRLLLISSGFIVFAYTPHKSVVQDEPLSVQFEVKLREEIQHASLFLYVNYYKYGHELLVLKKLSDTNFKSGIIRFGGGNIDMSYVVLKDSLDAQDVIHNHEIPKHDLHLKRADTVFSLKYKPNIQP